VTPAGAGGTLLLMAVAGETKLAREVERQRRRIERLQDELARAREELTGLHAQLERRAQESSEKELQLERYAADLRETFKQERARAVELQRSYVATVRALAGAVEFRDAYTARHAERVAAYGTAIARAMGLAIAERPETEFGFLLHDIGKVAIPDAILHKSGRLSEEERALMKRHPVIGAEIIAGIEFLGEAAQVVRSHHERWDGSGYPDGLAGERIPVAARVFAVADVLDALTTKRPYRNPSPLAEARAMILAESGRQFDPAVVEAFASIDDRVLRRIRDGLA
jgi:putative nucleotidyltransferase with HDIG domain